LDIGEHETRKGEKLEKENSARLRFGGFFLKVGIERAGFRANLRCENENRRL
jgi:hypothetical protein